VDSDSSHDSGNQLGDVAIMTRWGRRASTDRGFTLTELMVFMALLGVVLTLAYSLSQAISAAQRSADRHTGIARTINYPMTRMSEIIMQNLSIAQAPAPGAMTLSVVTDQDLNDVQERHGFSIATVGGVRVLQQTTVNLNAAGVPVGAARVNNTMAPGITNAQDGVPVFRYFNATGTEITDMLAVPDDARSIQITIRATIDGRAVQESIMVRFRNRDM